MEIRKELKEYIENKIIPENNKNGKGFDTEHINDVIGRSIELSQNYSVNMEMVYVIAAYHDIGHHINAKEHEKVSSKIFIQDKEIKKYFEEEEINIMKEAIEDHRASSKKAPRSIYGKIIESAEKGILDIEDKIKRTYWYGKAHMSYMTEEEQKERLKKHLRDKFRKDGYAKVYIKDEKYNESEKEFRRILENEEEFNKKIDKVIKEINCY